MSGQATEVNEVVPNEPGPFPVSQRVLYSRNPLNEVVCQVRFPPILLIESEPPAAFQEAIRQKFPLYSEVREAIVPEFPPGAPEPAVHAIRAALANQPAQKSHEFATADGVWKVKLSRGALSMATSKYHRWEEFSTYYSAPLQALLNVFRPAFLTRIGLRYQDLIQRSKLHLSDVSWAELLNPRVAGELGESALTGKLEESFSQVLVRLSESGEFVRIRHGLARAASNNEECYAIDSDFYVETKIPPNDVTIFLNRLNRHSGRLFRWCITERLHDAMGPEPLG